MDLCTDNLLDRLRDRGELADWEEFLDLYLPLLAEWAREDVRAGDDPAGLVDATMARVMEKITSFNGTEYNLATWVRGVMTECARQRRREEVPWARRVDLLILEATGRREGARDGLKAAERDQLLGRALRTVKVDFPAETQKAFWEYRVAGRPAAEVAAKLGISRAAVYLADRRVRKRLREELSGRGK
jgi:RNA polymerase sigma-70 factor (ECF subfamily)